MTESVEARLHDVLARRCRGSVLALEGGDSSLARALVGRGLEAHARSPIRPDWSEGLPPFRTVLVGPVLGELPTSESRRLLKDAWTRLGPKGRLIAVVANAEVGEQKNGGLDRRRLDRLLRDVGKPKLVTEQPYRWLVMVVEKKRRPREHGGNRSREDRYRVTAELCMGRVIELGCGEGKLAATIAARGCDVVGVDLSERKIAAARVAHPELVFLQSDIRDLDLPAGAFDTVVLAEVLEHVTERPGDEILQAAWRLLRTGGRLVVSVPNEECVPHRNHLRQFSRKRLDDMLAPFGRAKWVSDQPFKWLLSYVEKRT